MANIIKLRRGLDINLKGKATKEKRILDVKGEYVLLTSSFTGVHPKIVVHEGDEVHIGDPLFISKNDEAVNFSSPVSGIITAILRGERRKLLSVKIASDGKQTAKKFNLMRNEDLNAENIIKLLLETGLFGYLRQLPYGIVPKSSEKPRAIFVSSFRDMPLSADFEYELEGLEKEFQSGLTILSKISKTYLGVSKKQHAKVLMQAKNVDLNVFDGPAPAGNPSVQINHIAPVNKGEIVWMVDPSVVLLIGKFFTTGVLDYTRTIAVAGSEIKNPSYVQTLVGTPLNRILENQLGKTEHLRIINGNPLTGTKASLNDYLMANVSEITVIPEGDDNNEMFGWILPRFNHFSMNRSYFSWLFGKKEYKLDARIKGGERHLIMSGEYDKVLPMDIYGEFLIKAIIAEDIDKMEQLGIYEVCPEDFALAEFVDSSKLELQKIVRKGLDMLYKENA